MTGDESPVYPTVLAKASLSLIHQASFCRIHPRAGTHKFLPFRMPYPCAAVGVGGGTGMGFSQW